MNLILVRQKHTHFGGAERFLSRALSSLTNQGVDVSVLSRNWEESSQYQHIVVNPFYVGRTWRDKSFLKNACKAISQIPDAIVQSHERIPCCDIYRAGDGIHREWLKQRSRVRGRSDKWFSSLSPFNRHVLSAEKRLYESKRLKKVICNSFMVKSEIMSWFDFPEEKIAVIHSGVDTGIFHSENAKQYRDQRRSDLNIPEDAMVVLFVGSGYERKGLTPLLEALAEAGSDVWLLVVGKESRRARYHKQAKMLGIEERVLFLGAQENVIPFYGLADVFALPTLYDPFPNVVLEAMACGLPVITSFKSGAVDIIEQGRNGFVVDALDTPEITRCINRLVDPEVRHAMGESARKTVEPMTLENMAIEYQNLYQQLIGE